LQGGLVAKGERCYNDKKAGVTRMDDRQMLEAFRQIVRDEIKPLQAEQRVTNERLSKIEANQEYSLNWLDRVEQRLNPVADYVETMLLHKDT